MTEPVPAQRLRQRSSFFARSVAASIRHLAGLPGLMQADAFAGIQSPLRGRPQAGAHNRRCLLGHHGAFGLARISKAPIAAGAGIDALFAIEREIIGLAPPQRVAVLSVRSRPLIVELDSWLREQRAKVSKNSDTDYSLKPLDGAHPFPPVQDQQRGRPRTARRGSWVQELDLRRL
jgi:hypothetical protein